VHHKNLILALLLLFAGQVLSAPFGQCSAQNDGSNQNSMMSMVSMMDHEMPMTHHSDSSSATDIKMDCCEDCTCPMDMCLSQIFFSTSDHEIVAVILQYSQVFDFSIRIKSTYPSSIYRPPILS